MNNTFNEMIFGKNDIRGIVKKDFSPELYENIGKAYATYISAKEDNNNEIWLSVAQDARSHSSKLTDLLIKGLRSCGINVLDIGLCPSPLGYFSEYADLNISGSLVVTASHNPPEYNGLKMTYKKISMNEQDIINLKKITQSEEFISSSTQGQLKKHNIIKDYIKTVGKPFINVARGVKVVVDSANATGGVVAPELYTQMGCEVIEMYSKPDGNFPNHHPDPSKECNLEDLKAKVLETNADIGIAFDGDSDRIGVVDNLGRSLPGDKLMLIFALDILANHKEGRPTFVSEVKCSQVLYDTIEKNGGKAVMWKTGHGFIKSKMKEENALMAGEMSGHIFFKDKYYGYDDAVYAGCRILEIIANKKQADKNFKITDIIESLPKVFTSPEIRTPCPNELKYKIVEELKEELTKNNDLFKNKIVKIITIDGMRLVFEDGFALIRASNTEPTFTIRFEASTEENLANYQETLLGILDKKLKQTI